MAQLLLSNPPPVILVSLGLGYVTQTISTNRWQKVLLTSMAPRKPSRSQLLPRQAPQQRL